MPKFEGTVESVVFRNDTNGWTVISFTVDGSGRISAVGTLPFISAGEHVILDGEITEHPDYGSQIKVTGYEVSRPETKSGIEKYLGSGLIRGVGPATAKLIIKKFGTRALDILESEPERLLEIPGIGPKKAAMIRESFEEQNGARNTLIYLQSAGLTMNLSMRVYKAYGESSEAVLRQNPYKLADEIEGVGFRTADKIALNMGFQPGCPERLNSGVRYVLTEAGELSGHLYLPKHILIEKAAEVLGAEQSLVEQTVQGLVLNDRLISCMVKGEEAVYLPNMYKAERETAKLLTGLKSARCTLRIPASNIDREIREYEHTNNVELAGKQRNAVKTAAESGICVITGGPGTGKTTSINCILSLFKGRGAVELCAPTGRAAKRMSEATGCEARTIHRLLEYNGENGGFTRDEDEPIKADVVIVDEMSMVDIFLMRSLLRALKRGTKLILVGDADQLPSVGAGNVLRDIISSQILPTVRLDQIFRQGEQSHIVVNAHRINKGEYPLIRNKDTDFFLERKETVQAVSDSVVALVSRRLPAYLNTDRLRGIQVMAPMKKGGLGVLQFNATLQAALNPPDVSKGELNRGDCVFRLGDKVMQIRNDYELEWERGNEHGEGVFNGDIGYITKLSRAEREMTVEFDDGRVAEYDDSMLDELELSYCISVHKSQGSEFDAVVLPLLNGPQMLLTRNLLYTAVTRAKRLVVIVGREGCIQQMVDNNRITLRYTALDQCLKELTEA